MRYPQVLIYETDGRLAEFLRREAPARHWSIREPRRLESCLRFLQRGRPAVLIVKLASDLIRELTLVERIAWLYPDTFLVVLSETNDAALASLAWDLGASLVLGPFLEGRNLPEIIDAFMSSTGSDAAVPGPAPANDTPESDKREP